MSACRKVFQYAQKLLVPHSANNLHVAGLSLCADWFASGFFVSCRSCKANVKAVQGPGCCLCFGTPALPGSCMNAIVVPGPSCRAQFCIARLTVCGLANILRTSSM